MSLSTTTSKDIQTANGGTYPNDIYTYPFRILAASELEVYDDGVLLTLTTDYTVTGVGDATGGTISFESGSEPAAASELIFKRVVTVDQEVDIPSAPAKFPEEAVEQALDKLTMIDQQQDEVAGRALTFPATVNTNDVSNIVQDPVANAGKVLSYSATGISATTILSSDIASPVSTEGDLLTFTTVPAALPVGTDDQALVVDTGVPGKVKWADMPATRGDVLTRDATDNSILALGTTAQTLGSDGTDLIWTQYPWAQGQCRLVYTSTSNITLTPFNGDTVILKTGSVWGKHNIPSAGVVGNNLTMGTDNDALSYVYIYNNSGTLTMETSTTAPTTDTDTGFEVKTGDATRLLVGVVYHTSATGFHDDASSRRVRSWYNDPGVIMRGEYTANRSTSSPTYVILNSEITVTGVTWAGELLRQDYDGAVSQVTGATVLYSALGIDSTTVATDGLIFQVSAALDPMPIAHGHMFYEATAAAAYARTYYHIAKVTGGANAATFIWGAPPEPAAHTIHATGRK